MQPQRFSIRQLLLLLATAIVLTFGYSSASIAIELAVAEEDVAADAEAVAEDDGAEPVELDEARLIAGLAAYKEAGCRGCHGWAANGEREGPNPQGPSLRESLLPEAATRLTIACGRPGTEMPSFWRDAYRRDSTDCYGQTGADLGDLKPIRATNRLRDQALDDLTYYLANFIQGTGEITRAQCEFFYGDGASRCQPYPDEPA